MRNPAAWFSSETHLIQGEDECGNNTSVTKEQLHEIAAMLGLIDLADAAFYLDEEGHLEAFLSLVE